MTTLTQASNQWATRPFDQRFISLIELDQHCKAAKKASRAKQIESRALTVVPVNDSNHRGLAIRGPDGGNVLPTHWSFGQLAQRAGAPAGYLRDMPAEIAADCLNYGLQHVRDVERLGVLLYKNGGAPELRAVTGPDYGRIWNASITDTLVKRFGDGVTGDFRVPGEFGKAVKVTKENTTLYASDRDMFVFLADETHRITMKDRRDGKSGSLARGFFMWNSEVGKSKFGIATFLFDYVCCNRIVWGAEGFEEITIRHTSNAPDRWIEEALPALEHYANSSTTGVVKAIEAAKSKKIGNQEAVTEFLNRRFSRIETTAIKAAHMEDEGRTIETLWDATTGVTAYARTIQYADERVALEREAGKILKMGYK